MVVVVVASVGGVVAGERAPPVVDVVICPRRYLPSSVPPQPAATTIPAATRPMTPFSFRRSNRAPYGAETAQLIDGSVRA